jgi:acyl phosphate:glycerol-3-phosphate acyltransferase
MKIILICFIAYLAGSVNFAIIFFRLAGKADPRLSFSGNAGTTNVYRLAGLTWATIIFLLDIGRAVAVAALSVYYLSASFVTWAGFFLVLGNSYPCFHGFQGGKGVANYLGFSAYIAPWTALLASITWLAVYGVYRVPFIGSFFMTLILTMGHAFSFNWTIPAVTGAGATFALILFNHRKNFIEYRKKHDRVTPGE